MLKRIVSGFVGIPLLIYIVLQGGILLYLATMLIALVGLNEFYHAMTLKSYRPMCWLAYGVTVFLLTGFYLSIAMNYLFFLVFITVLLFSIVLLYHSKYTIVDISLSLYGIIYVAFFLGHIILTSNLSNSNGIWFIFIIAWSTDTFAYFGGYFFGKRKLCPKISPKKTVEGAIVGTIGSMLSCGIFAYMFFIEYMVMFIFLGMIGSIISQVGDLTASQIKRYTGLKDFGNLIPGHGGVLDRFDSILFTAPIVYYFFVLLIDMRL
ncbi:phosphatidate cytidylyltransferase [Clostridium formicaceticum]|uniref:Phosphatidate cytidylyltransferase n=1 Tax=Clostridium formicaceticum TaxID=1497 RepID=A0AAC9WGH6_9CLOT|nr:phosphatidate cytidylyltransferase [Clostridium formicaceticum]AOY77283.1 phosphatidate cytidylyltransferase [Clostridium formicaceticum]ARE87824.1 Phosphatidate cytidylyltransferase [Clostridium formicaceticum]